MNWLIQVHMENGCQSGQWTRCVLIPWFLLRRHLSRHVVHPVQEVTNHAKEAEEIAGVSKSALALFQVNLQVTPGVDDLHLMLLNVTSLLTAVCYNQLGSLLLYSLHLQQQHTTPPQMPYNVMHFPSVSLVSMPARFIIESRFNIPVNIK